MPKSDNIQKIRDAMSQNPNEVALFFKMLADVQARYPQGLPDKELQRLFASHQAAISGDALSLHHPRLDRQEVDSRKIAGFRPLPRRLCGAHQP